MSESDSEQLLPTCDECDGGEYVMKSICNCAAPFPSIDLTPAFMVDYTNDNSRNEGKLHELRTMVKEAASRYGCFHVTLDSKVSSINNEGQSSPASNHINNTLLANDDNVTETIESLFTDKFLSSCRRDKDQSVETNATDDDNDESMMTVQYYNKKQQKVNDVTYRGRMAESGSVQDQTSCDDLVRVGEPKQSWEFFRTGKNTLLSTYADTTNCDQDSREISCSINPLESNVFTIVADYIDILHSVAVKIFSLLDLPLENFIETLREDQRSRHKETTCKSHAIDLLRAFRYDSLTSIEEQMKYLGSNEHTDWGSLTVVWQDSPGLQVYCEEHQRWSDVDMIRDKQNEQTVRLFIHVGDFLSLSMKKSSQNYNHVAYPSPLHRVLCPLKSTSASSVESDSRCSLVYFVYPPMNVSINDASESIEKRYIESTNETQQQSQQGEYPYDRYMVLKNQSASNTCGDTKQSNQVIAKKAFDEICKQPFQKVIQRKWDQVQRS